MKLMKKLKHMKRSIIIKIVGKKKKTATVPKE